MLQATAPLPRAADYDLKQTIGTNRAKSMWRLMEGYRGVYVISAFCMGLSALANTSIFLLLAWFIDSWLGNSAPAYPLWGVVAAILGLAIAQGFFTFTSRRLAAQCAEGIAIRNRNYLYDHIQRLPFTYHDQTQTGDLLQRATSDVETIRRFFADQAIEAGRVVLLFIVNVTAVWWLYPTLAWVSIVILPLVLLLSVFFFSWIEKSYSSFQEQDAILSTRLQENLTGVRVVKAFARQEFEINKFDEVNTEKYVRGKRLLLIHATYWPLTDILCVAQMLLGFWTAATLTMDGTITIGVYTAYVGLLTWIIWPLRNLGRLIVQMSQSFVSFGRISEVVKQDREPMGQGSVDPDTQVQGRLRFENVSFTYPGADHNVLENISFEVEPGKSVALLGTTGSGKTSLVNLLPRFYDYTAGSVTLDGVELREYPRSMLRRQIGIVEQEPFLFSMNVRANMTYGVGHAVSDQEVEDAARAAAIHDVILDKLPLGYKTVVGERGITLSGGQKQRVAIARTLLKDPRILILDDSTSSVDTETEAEIREALARLMEGRTTFIIAHRIQSVMDADQIMVLDKGKVIQHGTHEELLAQPGTYRRIFDAQTRIEQELEQELSSDSAGRSNRQGSAGYTNGSLASTNGAVASEASPESH